MTKTKQRTYLSGRAIKQSQRERRWLSSRRPIPLRVLPERSQVAEHVACTDCARCCTYVAVGINAPSGPRYATDILWYLYHEGTQVYLDGEGEWCVMFAGRCRNLGEDNLCRIYPRRPHICRTFDDRSCDVNCREGEATTFRRPEEFAAWLAQRNPRVYRLIRRFVQPEHRPAIEPSPGAGRRGRPKRRRA